MDRVIEKKQWNTKRILTIAGITAIVGLIATSVYFTLGKSKLNVDTERISISEIKTAAFHEFIILNGVLLPESTIYLDVMEGGRVEEKFVEDGAMMKKVEEVLDKMQIMHRRKHYPQQLSGGQQHRVTVARAVVNNPKLILANEPTGNLDSLNGNEVIQLLTVLNEQGTTIIMVTHSEHYAKYSHRIIRMLDGQSVTENILV